MNINIEISDVQAKFLKQFSANQHAGAKDNLGTFKPLHIVQDLRPIIIHEMVPDQCYCSKYYCRETDRYYDSPEELVMSAKHIQEEDVLKFETGLEINGYNVYSLEDYFYAYGVHGNIAGFMRNYDNVSYHFSLASARDYIKYQKHNLSDPRTYTVDPGYSNAGDYEPLWDLLMEIGTRLVESEKNDNELTEVAI